MSDRGSRSPKERASNVKGTKVPKQPEDRQKRVSRAQREAKRQKQLRWGAGLAAAAVLVILLGFATWDYVIKPRQVLATVDGTRIRREDYWKFRKLELYQQMTQYSQFSQMVGDQQQAQQYQSLALQAQSQLGDVWGSTDVNDQTLQQMIDNQIYLHSLDDLNITITDEELETWTLNQFSPADAPLIEPTVTPTYVPERAEWATQTAEALMPTTEATPTTMSSELTPIGGASPIAQASPMVDNTAAASPTVTNAASPVASPIASPEAAGATPIVDATPIGSPAADASPVVTMEPTPTVGPEQARATAETTWQTYQSTVLDQANMSVSDYFRLSARPQLAQQKIRDAVTADIGQTADQVHARHILVATEELANQLYTDITNGTQDFAVVAAQSSTDTATAPNGGDLGWFTRGVMVEAFEEVAFSTEAGQVAPPVQSNFGWHIIQVIDTQSGRALTEDQITQLQQSTMDNWLAERQQQLSISSVMAPTPTPSTANFVPPIDAPPIPTATAFPEQTFEPTTPDASPVVSETASSVASPVVTEPASPIASPITVGDASPAASPAIVMEPTAPASPVASPAVVTEPTTAASPVASPAVVAQPTVAASPVASPAVVAQPTVAASPIASPAATPGASPVTSSATVVTAATPAPNVPVVTQSTVDVTPDACAEASPSASPIASPVASPMASPVASPVASPFACGTP